MATQAKLFKERLTLPELEQFLWKAADILRGAVKPEKYGSFMLPLLFSKRLSDVYLEEYDVLQRYKSEEAAQKTNRKSSLQGQLITDWYLLWSSCG